MAETAIVNRILKYLESQGCWAIKTHGAGAGRNGIPDIIACVPDGRLLALEVKQRGGRATPLQLWELSKIQGAGGLAGVVTSVKDVDALLWPPKQEAA